MFFIIFKEFSVAKNCLRPESASLSNFENVLQRNLRTDRTIEGIFTASGGTNFGNFPAQHQPWCLLRFNCFEVHHQETGTNHSVFPKFVHNMTIALC